MTEECPFCGGQWDAERLAVVSIDGRNYYGTLWRCPNPDCGVISDEMGQEVSP